MARRIVLTGGHGRLGSRLLREFDTLGREAIAPSRRMVDWSVSKDVRNFLSGLGPSIVVALASYTDVARAERSRDLCARNTIVTARETAIVCEKIGLPLIYVSSDYVVPLLEGRMGGVYAEAKLRAEQEVIKRGGYVVRMAFTTPEQVRGWTFANNYTKSNRWWVEDAAYHLAKYVSGGGWNRIEELGPSYSITPADLLRGRYPDHPALQRLVNTPDEMKKIVGYAAPVDTRFHWSAEKKVN